MSSEDLDVERRMREIGAVNIQGTITGRLNANQPELQTINPCMKRGLHVLTFDPGKTTGWSYWINHNLVEVGVVMNYADLLICFGAHPDVQVVVFEGFARANASTGDQLQAIEMCGAINCLAVAAKVQVKKQFPANRKGYVPYAKQLVKDMGIPAEQRPHITDAVAHGARYLHKEVHAPWPELDLALSRISED